MNSDSFAPANAAFAFAMPTISLEDARAGGLPIPSDEFFLPVKNFGADTELGAYDEFAFVTWQQIPERGWSVAPVGCFVFRSGERLLWKGLALAAPHPMGVKMGVPAASAELFFGPAQSVTLSTVHNAPRFDEFSALQSGDVSFASANDEETFHALQTGIRSGICKFRVYPPFTPWQDYQQFAWVGPLASRTGTAFDQMIGAWVYEKSDGSGIVYHPAVYRTQG